MAIDTTNKKLAVMEMEDYWEPALPISPGAFDATELQQLLWGYPGITWATVTLTYILDMNTRLMSYLCTFYGVDMGNTDNATLIRRYLDNEPSGDYTNRFRQLIDGATP